MQVRWLWPGFWIVAVAIFAFMHFRSKRTVDIFHPTEHILLDSSGGSLALTVYPKIVYGNFDSGDPGGIWVRFPFESSADGRRNLAYSRKDWGNTAHEFQISWMILGLASVFIFSWLARKEVFRVSVMSNVKGNMNPPNKPE